MKNLINKVLVVLVISALFAGNISAVKERRGAKTTAITAEAPTPTPKSKGIAGLKAIQEATATLNFFELVKTQGGESFGQWTKDARKQAIIAQYGSIKDAHPAVVAYLIGKEGEKGSGLIENRKKHEEPALKAIANDAVKVATKDLTETTKKLEIDPKNEDLQKLAINQKGILESMTSTMKSYATTKNITVAAVALVTIGAVWYNIFGSYDFLAQGTSTVYNYLADTRAGGLVGSAAQRLKAYAMSDPLGIGAKTTAVLGFGKRMLGYGEAPTTDIAPGTPSSFENEQAEQALAIDTARAAAEAAAASRAAAAASRAAAEAAAAAAFEAKVTAGYQ